MKNLIIFAIFITFTTFIHGQSVKLSNKNRRKEPIAASDTIKAISSNEEAKEYNWKVRIVVVPEKASNALITIVKTTKILEGRNTEEIETITPDTLGIWPAPLDINLSSGNYNLVANKEGFKEELETIEIKQNKVDEIKIKILSNAYLESMRTRWNKIKWINAAVALGAGLAAYYFHNKTINYQEQYNNAISPNDIQDKRNNLIRMRSYFSISSGIAITALGGFGISWLIQQSY